MLKRFFIYGCLLFSCCLMAFNSEDFNLPVIRKQLITAMEKKQVTDSLYNALNKAKTKPPVIVSYIGALEALKAKHAWNPYYKIKYISNAEKSFAKAVAAEPHNIEIRFMRFSVEHNVPGFLGYDKNLESDKTEMIRQIDKKNYGSADKQVVITIIKFLLESKRCTTAEVNNLNQHLAQLQ